MKLHHVHSCKLRYELQAAQSAEVSQVVGNIAAASCTPKDHLQRGDMVLMHRFRGVVSDYPVWLHHHARRTFRSR